MPPADTPFFVGEEGLDGPVIVRKLLGVADQESLVLEGFVTAEGMRRLLVVDHPKG